MTDDTQPEAMDLADWLEAVGGGGLSPNRCAALLREQHARIAELEAQLEAVGAGGVQALSAAPAVPNGDELRRIARSARTSASDDASPTEYVLAGWKAAMLAASPTTPAEQAAPKAAPGVGNSGFDHQTAADFLSGKTVSVEALRKFVHASRRAHDEKTSLSAMLLSVRGVLASREAEIALLKKALMEAEAAPQQ